MRTLYIDVYFLINLTVDTIALYFACLLVHIRTTKLRLLLSALLGALFAVITVLLPEYVVIKIICILLGPVGVCFVAGAGAGLYRKLKLSFAFLIFSALLGGGVNLLWSVLDGLIGDYKSALGAGEVNRKFLTLALAVLLSLGVFKLIVAFFSGGNGGDVATLNIKFGDKAIELDALVDSGNLALDPMDMQPVMLIKKTKAMEIFPEALINLCDLDLLSKDIRKRIRLVPISMGGKTKVLTGIKADSVSLGVGSEAEQINVTVAIDREEGSFGGCPALVPASAVCDVKK